MDMMSYGQLIDVNFVGLFVLSLVTGSILADVIVVVYAVVLFICCGTNLPWTSLPAISTRREPEQPNEQFQPRKSPLEYIIIRELELGQ